MREPCRIGGLALLWAMAWSAFPVWAQLSEAQEAEERARIQAQREVIAVQKQQDEAACYQRFAVEDCLQQVRRKYRQQESRLRKQEVQLNEARRKAREVERQQALAASQAEAAKHPPPAVQAQVRKACSTPDCQEAVREREQQAQERARAQQQRVQSHVEQTRQRQDERERQAAAARERQARLQAEVDAQRERRAQEQAQAAAQGKKPAAPLPLTPPPATPAALPE